MTAPIAMAAADVANRIKQSYTLPDAGIILTDTVVLKDLDAPPPPRTRTPGKRVKVYWRGPSSVPVFALENCREASFAHVDVYVETQCDSVFHHGRVKSGPGTIPPTMPRWHDVRIFGNGKASIAFALTGIDENNEHGRWESCSVYGCIIGWLFAGQQSKEHLLTNCRAESCVTAMAADTSFQWIGGTVAVCDIGIDLERVGDPVKIQSVGFEACKRLLVTAGPTTDAQPIVLDSCRFAADQLHEDRAMILLRHAGPLTLIGGSYGDGDQRPPHIQLAGIGEQGVHIAGAKFGAFGAVDAPAISSNPGVRPLITGDVCAFQNPETADERTSIRWIGGDAPLAKQ